MAGSGSVRRAGYCRYRLPHPNSARHCLRAAGATMCRWPREWSKTVRHSSFRPRSAFRKSAHWQPSLRRLCRGSRNRAAAYHCRCCCHQRTRRPSAGREKCRPRSSGSSPRGWVRCLRARGENSARSFAGSFHSRVCRIPQVNGKLPRARNFTCAAARFIGTADRRHRPKNSGTCKRPPRLQCQ